MAKNTTELYRELKGLLYQPEPDQAKLAAFKVPSWTLNHYRRGPEPLWIMSF